MESKEVKNRFMATFYGQAIGDALGVGTEFMSKEEVQRAYPDGLTRYDQIKGYHSSKIAKGDWSDDTDMLLCIAKAIIEDGGQVNEKTIARKFLDWADSPRAHDIGNLTSRIVYSNGFLDHPSTIARETWEEGGRVNAPNGGLMRTAVIGLLKDNVKANAETACRVTHYDPRCVGSCVITSEIINSLVWHNKALTKDDIISIARKYDKHIVDYVKLATHLDIADLQLGVLGGSGYTLKCLSVVLWCYFHVEYFDRGLMAVVNEGGDADTNAAPACAVMGAKFGLDGIPEYYIQNLLNKDKFDRIAEDLWQVVNQ